jgi:hypothetical protein
MMDLGMKLMSPYHPWMKRGAILLSGLRAAANMLSPMAEAAPNDLENRGCMMMYENIGF